MTLFPTNRALVRGLSALLLVVVAPQVSPAHETDQYSVPVGREFADLRHFFSEEFRDALVSAAEATNERIKRSLRDGYPTVATERLRSPEAIARAVVAEFPPVVNHTELLELEFRSTEVRARYPGLVIAHMPPFWIYHHWALLLDLTKPIRWVRTSTIMVDGSYLGTDKIVHFVHMGFFYHAAYRRALASGLTDEEATKRAVSLGAGADPFFSENTLLGMLTTGVRSNADLAANYAGLKFYQNLTEPVRVRGAERPPLLVRDGLYWRLNGHVRTHSDFFTAFVTDHWDEALNPNTYAPGVGICVRQELRRRCDALRGWYLDRQGRPMTRRAFASIAEELSTYFGEEYGHVAAPEGGVSIASCCFPDQRSPSAGAAEHVSLRPGSSVDERDLLGRTALWWAAYDGDVKKLTALIDSGADTRAVDLDGESPLHCAARWGRASTIDVLLAHGADPNTKAAYGITPLHVASRELRGEAMAVLIRHAAKVDVRDVFGCTPLHDASGRGDERLIETLLRSGANPNARDGHGVTPLHRAARAGHRAAVALLLSAGADRASQSDLGRTPYDEAVHGEHSRIAELLTEP